MREGIPADLRSSFIPIPEVSSNGGVSIAPAATITSFLAIKEKNSYDEADALEKRHIAQRRQQESTGAMVGAAPVINLKGKCVPGKIDLPGVVDSVNRHTQFVHRGGGDGTNGAFQNKEDSYGEPNTTPTVVSASI